MCKYGFMLDRRTDDLVSRRNDPKYAQVSGYINKEIAMQFKVACTTSEISQTDALEEAVALWVENKKATPLAVATSESASEAAAFLKLLAQGKCPTDAQIAETAQVTNISEEHLMELRDRLFPGNKPSSTKPK